MKCLNVPYGQTEAKEIPELLMQFTDVINLLRMLSRVKIEKGTKIH